MNFQVFSHTVIATGVGEKKRFITYNGEQAGAASIVLGVSKTDFSPGEAFPADILGVTMVESGGVVERGQPVGSDAQGRGVAVEIGAASFAGRAMNSVAGPGQFLFVLLR